MEPLRGEGATATVDDVGVVTRGCRLEDASLSVILDGDRYPRLAWADETATVAAAGAAASLTARGADRFESVRSASEKLLASPDVTNGVPRAARPRLFGGFTFHAGDNGGSPPLWDGFPDAAFVLPAVQVTRTGDETWLTATATGSGAETAARERLDRWRSRLADAPSRSAEQPTVTNRRYTPGKAGWRRQVRDALDSVADGSLRKVVLAQALTLELSGRPSIPELLASLGDTYPRCRRFLFAPNERASFFGVTPERLVSLRGRTVETEALAGSTGRGETPAEDEWLADQLQNSRKDALEHDLVVEAIRDQLVPLASSVRTGERSLRRLATVQHLRTPMTAKLDGDAHVLSLVEALHPTPAVGGLPPNAALSTIRETEAFDRGWYAAPVGWFDASGDGSFSVAIRSALVRESPSPYEDDAPTERADESVEATLFAGAGIVEDSDPDAEWDEVQLKYRPILDEFA